jgi:cytochrome o ubiquinol oxidase operon protein cyoD
MSLKSKVVAQKHSGRGSLTSYSIGFAMSILLTLDAYLFTVHHIFTGQGLVWAVMGLAWIQLLVQLLFFLHLGSESKPRWNLVMLLFALMVLVIIVFGSIWIMNNLNYHMSTPQEIFKDEGIQQSSNY